MMINERYYEDGFDPLLADVMALASLLNIHYHLLSKYTEGEGEANVSCLERIEEVSSKIGEQKTFMYYTYGEMLLKEGGVLKENLKKMYKPNQDEASQIMNVYNSWKDEVFMQTFEPKLATV